MTVHEAFHAGSRLLLLAAAAWACSASRKPVVCKGSFVSISARPENRRGDFFSSTGISVRAGDVISMAANGRWDVGVGSTGPDGRDEWCECVVRERKGDGFRGRLGALIGRIGKAGTPFIVGSAKTITAAEDGLLFFTANDNEGPCQPGGRGSCFDDNRGAIDVCVEVGAKPSNEARPR